MSVVETPEAKSKMAGLAKGHSNRKQGLRSAGDIPRFDMPFKGGGSIAAGAAGSGEWSPEDWGAEGGSFKHVESASELMALATEINGAMSYPEALGKREYSGTILTRLFFRDSGGCDWTRTKIFPGQPHFRVYILALLKKVCGLGQIDRMQIRTSDHVDLSFTFHLVNMGEHVEPETFNFTTGNVLAFERVWVRSPIKLDLGPLTLFEGDLVHLNFDWLFTQWDKLTDQYKDPMEPFREQ